MRTLVFILECVYWYRSGLSWLLAVLSVVGVMALYPWDGRFLCLLGLLPYAIWGPEICGLRADEDDPDGRKLAHDFRHLG